MDVRYSHEPSHKDDEMRRQLIHFQGTQEFIHFQLLLST